MKIFNKKFTMMEIFLYIFIPFGMIIGGLIWAHKKGYLVTFCNWVKSLFTKKTGKAWDVPTDEVKSNLPRGIRNKNPLNIQYNEANKWKGQTGSDGLLSKFDTMQNGCRAGVKLLQNYIKKGLDTVDKIVNMWEHGTGEKTVASENYVSFVANDSHILRDKVLNESDKDSIVAIAYAMHKFENGGTFVSEEEFSTAFNAI